MALQMANNGKMTGKQKKNINNIWTNKVFFRKFAETS